MSYSVQNSIDKAYNYIQSQRLNGYKYRGTPVYNVTKDDLGDVAAMASKYGFPMEWLINLFKNESAGTFAPSIQNSIGATGLIQFLPSTAAGLGTNTTALKQMTFKEQLKYVDKYIYNALHNKLKPDGKVPDNFTQGDLFMTIFYPAAVGKPDFVFPDSVQKANNGIAKPKDYVNRALNAAIFPLTEIPYTLDEVKKKFGQIANYTKQNFMPIALVILGLAGLAYYFISKNNSSFITQNS